MVEISILLGCNKENIVFFLGGRGFTKKNEKMSLKVIWAR